MSSRRLIALCVALGGVAAAAPASADYVWVSRDPAPLSRSHFYLGAQPVASVLLDQRGPDRFLGSGAGFNLFMGGRVARSVALQFGWQPTFHGIGGLPFDRTVGAVGLSAFTFDVKILPWHGWVQPYFNVGPGFYALTDIGFGPLAVGGGYQIGGGVDFWILPHLSVGGVAEYRGFGLLNYNPGGDSTYLSMLNLGVNIQAHF